MNPILYSNLSQHILSQSSNISYLIRNTTRMNVTPDDRRADYSFRDIYTTVLVTGFNEWAMRLMEAIYMAPRYVKLMGFHNLANEYKDIPGAENYTRLPRVLQSRLMGHLSSEKSFFKVARLLRDYDTRDMTVGTPEFKERKLLAEHFERRFNFKDYLKNYYDMDKGIEASAAGVKSKAGVLDKVIQSINEQDVQHFAVTPEGTTAPINNTTRSIIERAINQHKDELVEAFGEGWRDSLLNHVDASRPASQWQKKIVDLVHDGITSRFVEDGVKFSRKSGSWLKLGGGLLANFAAYGLTANWFDFNVVQPWQSKLVEKRGTAAEVVAPQVWSLIPAAAVGVAIHKLLNKKNLGYANRFMLAFGPAFLVYTASSAAGIINRLSKPPKGKFALLAENGKRLQAERKEKSAIHTQAHVTHQLVHSPLETQNPQAAVMSKMLTPVLSPTVVSNPFQPPPRLIANNRPIIPV